MSGFVILPNYIKYDEQLNSNEKLILIEIRALSQQKGYCYASNDHFAKILGVTKDRISRYFSNLQEKGYINIEFKKGENNGIMGRKIFFIEQETIEKQNDSEITTEPPAVDEVPYGENTIPYGENTIPYGENTIRNNINKINNKNNINKINNTDNKNNEIDKNNNITPLYPPKGKDELVGIDDMFEEFWEAYPKKMGKAKARKIFRRIKVNRALLEQMLVAIRMQKNTKQWLKDNGQYIPYPTTWLSQERWEDEVQEVNDDDTGDHSESETRDIPQYGSLIIL